jgi:hypothetical protein
MQATNNSRSIPMLAIVAAITTCAAIIVGTRLGKNEYWTYPLILMGMPFFYVIFALLAGLPDIVGKELLVALPFLLLGVLSCLTKLRWTALILAAGWLLHGIYDFSHDVFFHNAGRPVWFGVFCGLIDVGVAIYLVLLSRSFSQWRWVYAKVG